VHLPVFSTAANEVTAKQERSIIAARKTEINFFIICIPPYEVIAKTTY
jgi:hypothetical protein